MKSTSEHLWFHTDIHPAYIVSVKMHPADTVSLELTLELILKLLVGIHTVKAVYMHVYKCVCSFW